ncbi:hypothetical protein AB0E12_14190 [Micromonospora chersina]
MQTMAAAVDELIRSGDVDAVLSKVQADPGRDDRLPAGGEPDAV